jgi:stage III sporulation protein AD
MSVLKLSVCAVLTVILMLTIKKDRADFAVLTELAGAAFLIFYVASYAAELSKTLMSLLSSAGINGEYLRLLIKVLFTAAAAETASAVCRDNGATALAVNVELVSKLIILVMCAPMIVKVAEFAAGLIGL